MHKKASLALAIAIMALSCWGTVSALAWPWKAKLFPLVIGIPLFCLATAELLWVIFGSAAAAKASDFQLAADVPVELARRRTALAAGWIIGFFLLILLLGFPVAVPTFVFLYLKLQAREGWLFCTIFTAALWAGFYGLFDLLLHLPFPPGLLLDWLA